ncbi:hypothetical protein IB286_09800 [Spongiibacter sp. KMU-158]|uniref:Uncharacterized protein n=1 Tax=Spongiibacter pelagi TaxID=2760804 RepID=A0A927C480_9GAMM|nr:hypothetical protein [Spongiibacter pelagi]MBD2859301.1 hypothetical protein [Spongiibacter pelagi]
MAGTVKTTSCRARMPLWHPVKLAAEGYRQQSSRNNNQYATEGKCVLQKSEMSPTHLAYIAKTLFAGRRQRVEATPESEAQFYEKSRQTVHRKDCLEV